MVGLQRKTKRLDTLLEDCLAQLNVVIGIMQLILSDRYSKVLGYRALLEVWHLRSHVDEQG